MKRYFIEEVKCGVTEGGMACGPVGGSVVTSIKFRENNEAPNWLNLVEVSGIPNAYISDKDVYDDLIKEDFDDKEFNDYMEDHFEADFEGIDLTDYAGAFECMYDDQDNPAVPLIRYLITLTRCSTDEVEGLIKLVTGKYIDEVEVPMSEDEEEWLADQEEDEEDT